MKRASSKDCISSVLVHLALCLVSLQRDRRHPGYKKNDQEFVISPPPDWNLSDILRMGGMIHKDTIFKFYLIRRFSRKCG